MHIKGYKCKNQSVEQQNAQLQEKNPCLGNQQDDRLKKLSLTFGLAVVTLFPVCNTDSFD